MNRWVLFFGLCVVTGATAQTHTVRCNGHTFTLPDGFTIELAAKTPLVDRPIVATYDDRGRFYVADSSGSNDKPSEQLKNPTHRIMRLEDTDGDGVFDRSTVFADKMMFPEGILWHQGHLYVAAPPHIWRLTDTDSDGKADQRAIWFDGKTLTGCANDLHGPYLGPDGWLYWCKGAFAKQTYKLPNGKEFTTNAAHIFRAKPDGTHIEPVMTGGMDNPVDVAFLPNGERFFTTTFFQHPAAGKRDGMIHALYGAIYGKDHAVIYDADHRWTGPTTMPVMTHMGPAAPCGLHCYQQAFWGKEFTNNLFACQFNLRKVSRHILQRDGATYATKDSDFVVSDQQDFHPTDVLQDKDGSLLIVDTGGWYKLCCPSSQLVKTDVFGAIYRVRKKDAYRPKADYWKGPWNAKEDIEELIADGLNTDAYSAVGAWQVVDLLAARGDAALKGLRQGVLENPKTQSTAPWHCALWTAYRIQTPNARRFVEGSWEAARTHFDNAADRDEVQQTAVQVMSRWADRECLPFLMKHVADQNPITRRLVVEAMGRIGASESVPVLLRVLEEPADRALEHAVTYALISIGDTKATATGLTSKHATVQRCALTALDQMGAPLERGFVLAALGHRDERLKETALWIVGRHPEWATDVARVLQQRLALPTFSVKERDELVPQLVRLAKTEAVQAMLAAVLVERSSESEARRAVLLAMGNSGVKELPAVWTKALTTSLAALDSPLLPDILATLRRLPAPKSEQVPFAAAVEHVLQNATAIDDRLGAMAVVPGGLPKVDAAQFKLLCQALEREAPHARRGLAADVLTRTKLTNAQLSELVQVLPATSPLEVERLLAVFAQSTDDEIGTQLVAMLNTPALRPALRVDAVKERLKKYGPTVQQEATKLYAALNVELAQQTAKLDELVKTLPKGDIRRGQAVFNQQRTACIACHTIGYVGGKIGPDLTRIGGIRSERDLLEAVLYPSASLVRSFEPLTVRTQAGLSYNGIPKKDAPDELVLTLAADKEIAIPRKDIEDVQPSKVSIMPTGLDKQLSLQELADLIAFLRACR